MFGRGGLASDHKGVDCFGRRRMLSLLLSHHSFMASAWKRSNSGYLIVSRIEQHGCNEKHQRKVGRNTKRGRAWKKRQQHATERHECRIRRCDAARRSGQDQPHARDNPSNAKFQMRCRPASGFLYRLQNKPRGRSEAQVQAGPNQAMQTLQRHRRNVPKRNHRTSDDSFDPCSWSSAPADFNSIGEQALES
jgi:hypothetical protein